MSTFRKKIISNYEMKKNNEMVESLEDSRLLPEGVSKAIQNEVKKQRGRFPSVIRYTRSKFFGKYFQR